MARITRDFTTVLTYGYNAEHLANDIVGNNGSYNVLDTIVALYDGQVERICNNCNQTFPNSQSAIAIYGHSYGNYVLINHGTMNGHTYKTRYAHFGAVYVSVGQYVKEGQAIGFMGNTGFSMGGHTHFELIVDGVCVDPYPYLFQGKKFWTTLPTPVERDKEKMQLQVICGRNTLRCRTHHSTEADIIGFIEPAIYNIISTFKDNEYVWYEVEKGKWIANAINCIEILEIEKEQETADFEEKDQNNTNTLEKVETSENEQEKEENKGNKEKERLIVKILDFLMSIIHKVLDIFF